MFAHGLLHRRRHRVGIADIAGDVARRPGVPHDYVVARLAQPPATSRPIPDAPPVTRAVEASCRRTDQLDQHAVGAAMTAIATVLPPGAGMVIRRTPSAKPRCSQAG